MDIPNWYWKKGLHDAKITGWQFENFDYDYSQRNPIRNCITVELDSRMALFDTTLKTIKFVNAKIIQGDTQCVNWFWKDDIVQKTYKGYEIEITLTPYPSTKKMKIAFENIIIER